MEFGFLKEAQLEKVWAHRTAKPLQAIWYNNIDGKALKKILGKQMDNDIMFSLVGVEGYFFYSDGKLYFSIGIKEGKW